MFALFQDLRYAARQLWKDRTVAIVVVLTIALGIGVNTAVFSILNGFQRALPVKAPEQIVVLEREGERGIERAGEVALRRTARRARGPVDRRLGDLDEEVAAAGELLEVVAGDVGVEVELLGHRAGGDTGRAGVPREEVDLTSGGIAERVRDRAQAGRWSTTRRSLFYPPLGQRL